MNSLFAESALVRIVVRLAIPTHVATHLFPDLYPAVSIIIDSTFLFTHIRSSFALILRGDKKKQLSCLERRTYDEKAGRP